MLSLRELRRAARILEQECVGATLRRVLQTNKHTLVLAFQRPEGKAHVLISCRPEHARISLSQPPESESHPSSFCEYLRAHLSGSSLSRIEASDIDRQVRFLLNTRSTSFLLILSILGARSNIYLLDSSGTLVHSMRRLDATRRELKIGDPWTNPEGAAASQGIDRWQEVPDEAYLESIEEAYSKEEREHEAQLLARRIAAALRKDRGFLERKSVNLQEDLGEAQQAEAYRRRGELLKSVLHQVKAGDEFVKAVDYESGETVEIPIDPKKSPSENLEAYFARYQKESRGVRMIEEQLSEVAAALSKLEGIERRLGEALSGRPSALEALEKLAAQPQVRQLLKRYSPRQKGPSTRRSERRETPSRLLPKRYKTQDGLEIWVGRSDEGNDYLTTRLARGNDLFFHLEGYPGSHVILRTGGHPHAPPQSILEACELAVHFSKLKNSGQADVHMAPVKDVKKPKGSKPGLVYVRRGKTIHLRRDPKRLESILSARIDE
jgi:predicted ribosome quality control (RQC) complex YloA/Tae2 family protein